MEYEKSILPIGGAPECVEIDSYPEEHYSDPVTMYGDFPCDFPIANNCAGGQTFTTPASPTYEICRADFYLKRGTGTAGNVQAQLYEVTACNGNLKPTGDPLALSDKVAVSTLSNTEFELITFDFTGEEQYEMSTEHTYAILVVVIDNCNNFVYIGVDMTSPTHDGNFVYYFEAAWGCTSDDCIFYVYGIEV